MTSSMPGALLDAAEAAGRLLVVHLRALARRGLKARGKGGGQAHLTAMLTAVAAQLRLIDGVSHLIHLDQAAALATTLAHRLDPEH